jgi:hypothetical protein
VPVVFDGSRIIQVNRHGHVFVRPFKEADNKMTATEQIAEQGKLLEEE